MMHWQCDAGAESLDDRQLMELLRRRGAEGLEAIIRRHRVRVFRFLWLRVRDAGAAEDLTQDVFLRVYLARDRYEPSARFTTWLFCIATRLALNWQRTQRRARVTTSLEEPAARGRAWYRPGQENALLRQAVRRQVAAAVEQLPPRQRAIVRLHKYEGMQYTEIAAALGLSVGAVRSLLFRAYSRLRTALAPELRPPAARCA